MRLSVSSLNGVVLKPECAAAAVVLAALPLLYFIRPEEEYIVLLLLLMLCAVGVLVGVLSGVLLWNCLEDRTAIVDFDDFGVVDS